MNLVVGSTVAEIKRTAVTSMTEKMSSMWTGWWGGARRWSYRQREERPSGDDDDHGGDGIGDEDVGGGIEGQNILVEEGVVAWTTAERATEEVAGYTAG